MAGRARFLAGEQLWAELSRVAAGCEGVRRVASPFLGERAGDLIGLRKDDVLLVAATVSNAKSGSVSPKELRRLHRRGVRLYSVDDLHAKVYLLGRTAFVGSNNLSASSHEVLDEAAVRITDAKALDEVQAWFVARATSPIGPSWLKELEKAYRPPRGGGARKVAAQMGPRLWMAAIDEVDEISPPEEVDYGEAALEEAKQRARAGYEVEMSRFDVPSRFLREVKRGDLLVHLVERGRGVSVTPHGRVLSVKRRRFSKKTVLYCYVEVPTDYETLAWSTFRRQLARAGTRLPEQVYAREVRGAAARRRVLGLTNPENLGTEA